VDELGSILREAREARGLSLAEAQDATRINSKFLEALEDGQYHELPTPVHARGFLRNYSRYLGLEPEPLLERFSLTSSARTPAPTLVRPNVDDNLAALGPIAPGEDKVFFEPVNVDLESRGRDSGTVLRLLVILALLISLALVANRFIPMLTGSGDGTEALTAGIQELVGSIRNEPEEEENPQPTPDLALIPGADEEIASTSRNDALQLPTPTATRPSLPATMEIIRFRLDVTERTWMRVTVDDEVVYEGLARRGDGPFEWQARTSVNLLTGNAIGLVVTINDVELGRMGGRGEVADETWNTTQ
jgi:cytoskeleton protein RodZ